MGIGLFMARRIMERQNGSLTVVSAGADKGSTFTVKLPISQ
jgi:signal transduction histidine kinase